MKPELEAAREKVANAVGAAYVEWGEIYKCASESLALLVSEIEERDKPCKWMRAFDGHFNISCCNKTNQRANGRWKGAGSVSGKTWEFDFCPYCGHPVEIVEE